MRKAAAFTLLVIFILISNLNAWEIKKEVFKTADGVTLVAKRYYNPGGIPVILQHGFALNFNSWDYPEKSFAKYLADRGYDVWITNLRGHGEGEYQSGPNKGPGTWDFDTFVAYDVPAMIKTVTKRTGKKPFWIGHSMGGTMMYAYLTGAYGIPVTGKVEGAVKMYISKEASIEHMQQLRGFVAIASPAGLSFPVNLKGKGLKALLKYNYHDYDLLIQMAASKKWKDLSAGVPVLTHNESLRDKLHLSPPLWVNNFFGTLALDLLTPAIMKYIGQDFNGDMNKFTDFIYWKMKIEPIDFILNMFWNTKNTTRDGIFFIIKYSLDNFSPRLVRQWYSWLRSGEFNEQCDTKGCIPANYLKYINRISLPTLLIAGGADKLVNKDNIRERVYEKISSTDKTYKVFQEYGHIDLLMGKHAEEVFKYVDQWLRRH